MHLAVIEAEKAASMDEVPVGAVIVRKINGTEEIIASSHNTRETLKNALNHAEILAIDAACQKTGSWRLLNCTLYVTLEPCPMCAGAIINSRIPRVVFGAKDPKAGAFGSVMNLNYYPLNFKPEVVSGVLSGECSNKLKNYFAHKRSTLLGRSTPLERLKPKDI